MVEGILQDSSKGISKEIAEKIQRKCLADSWRIAVETFKENPKKCSKNSNGNVKKKISHLKHFEVIIDKDLEAIFK